jgi:hypothetical protein
MEVARFCIAACAATKLAHTACHRGGGGGGGRVAGARREIRDEIDKKITDPAGHRGNKDVTQSAQDKGG